MPTSYSWLNFGDAQTALANRLADPGMVFWPKAELAFYIREALQQFNVLTGMWATEFQFQAPISADQIWYDLSAIPNSPRLRTTTDADIYTQLRYHLLEPPIGALTSQFTVADFVGALQRRREEIIQSSACHVQQITVASTPDIRRTALPDGTLEVIRARFVPASGFGDPYRLYRNDNLAFKFWEPGFMQEQQGSPLAYDVVSVPPLSLDVDVPPSVAGSYDVISIQAGDTFVDGSPKLIQIPNDFAWVLKWGALADLLGRESEATDRLRADWCLQRYLDGLKLMSSSPWLYLAYLNKIPVDTMSLAEMDDFAPEWDSGSTSAPDAVIEAGIDFFAISPVPTSPQTGTFLKVLGNAPLPSADSDFVQVSKDAWDSVLSMSQFLAVWKMGGAEFVDAKDLEKEFIEYCAYTNKRLEDLGVFVDILRLEGHRQDIVQERA